MKFCFCSSTTLSLEGVWYFTLQQNHSAVGKSTNPRMAKEWPDLASTHHLHWLDCLGLGEKSGIGQGKSVRGRVRWATPSLWRVNEAFMCTKRNQVTCMHSSNDFRSLLAVLAYFVVLLSQTDGTVWQTKLKNWTQSDDSLPCLKSCQKQIKHPVTVIFTNLLRNYLVYIKFDESAHWRPSNETQLLKCT